MTYPTLITLPFVTEADVPPMDGGEDRLPESLVRWALEEFTAKGDKILDPFFGLGSSVFEAEKMGRIPYGIEADEGRFQWVAGQVEHWSNLACMDSYEISQAGFPKMDFCLTSPPFMANTHKWNPLYGGDPDYAGYDIYLKRMADIFVQIAKVMKRSAVLAVHVDHIEGRTFTPLVRDMGGAIAQSFKPVGETIILWDTKKQDHPVMADNPVSHCLIFKKA